MRVLLISAFNNILCSLEPNFTKQRNQKFNLRFRFESRSFTRPVILAKKLLSSSLPLRLRVFGGAAFFFNAGSDGELLNEFRADIASKSWADILDRVLELLLLAVALRKKVEGSVSFAFSKRISGQHFNTKVYYLPISFHRTPRFQISKLKSVQRIATSGKKSRVHLSGTNLIGLWRRCLFSASRGAGGA